MDSSSVSPEVRECANHFPLVPHIISRLGFFNGQLWANLRCHWPLRSLIEVQLFFFLGLRRVHCSSSQTLHLQERDQGEKISRFPVVVGLRSALLISVGKKLSMSGHVSFALR